MKLQKIIHRIQRLHPKEIDLSLYRVKLLCKKLGNPQDKLKCIQVCGTNGKYSTIQALKAILNNANINCNIYTSPHIKRINERFVFNNKDITSERLCELLCEVEEINNGAEITFFEILTAAFFYECLNYKENLTICEFGLFARYDAVNILKKNLATIITPIGLDHLDWLPREKRNIDRIIFEKTSDLLNSNIFISRQTSIKVQNKIKNSLIYNKSKKFFFNENYKYSSSKNINFNYEDNLGKLKLPMPSLNGDFQLTNIATAVVALRNIKKINITEDNIKTGITKIKSVARIQEIKKGKLKKLCKKNRLFVDGSHNPLGAIVLNNFIKKLKCKVHIVLGMMNNKDHVEYIKNLKNISSLTVIDIPNQPSSIPGRYLKKKIYNIKRTNYEVSIKDAIKSFSNRNNEIILITGSLYLAGEVLKLN